MKRGFTLLELIVVIIIIGVLATLGFTQYTKVIEKGRTAEAKAILGQLRSAQVGRYQDLGAYGTLTAAVNNLAVDAPGTCLPVATATHFFQYSCAATGTCTATRCIGATGKAPAGPAAYTITLTVAGAWGGSPGYY